MKGVTADTQHGLLVSDIFLNWSRLIMCVHEPLMPCGRL